MSGQISLSSGYLKGMAPEHSHQSHILIVNLWSTDSSAQSTGKHYCFDVVTTVLITVWLWFIAWYHQVEKVQLYANNYMVCGTNQYASMVYWHWSCNRLVITFIHRCYFWIFALTCSPQGHCQYLMYSPCSHAITFLGFDVVQVVCS